jgi:type I restriction enzyme S subunit
MTNDWPEVRLGDICTHVTVGFVGSMTSEYRASGVTFLRSQNVKPYAIDLTDVCFIHPEFNEKIAKSRLHSGDVVIVRTGTPGISAVIPESLDGANCSDLVIARPSAKINSHYLAYYLNAMAQHHISTRTVGAVQQHFNVGEAKELRLPLPPRQEQDRISAILRLLDDKIAHNRRLNRTLERTAEALFTSWFVNFDPVTAKAEGRPPFAMPTEIAALFPDRFENSPIGPVPAGWACESFGVIAKQKRKTINPQNIASHMPYIGLEHMPRHCIALSDWGEADSVESNKSSFHRGDILFGKLRPYFHKVGVAPVDGVCSTDIIVITPVSPEWFGLVLGHSSSSEFVRHADATSGGTKMPRTSWDDMARYPIVTPDAVIAKVFTDIVQPMVERIAQNIHQSIHLAALRDALLPRLLSGTLRLPEADRLVAEVV